MDVVRIVRLVFGVVGIGLLVGAVVSVQHTRSFLADAVGAPGTVQQLVPRTSTDSDGRSSTTFAPVVEFTTARGESITFVSSTSSSPPAYQVGETVEVLYLADDPRDARIHDWFSLWGLPTILGGLGSVFTAVAGGLTLVGRRARRNGLSGMPSDLDEDSDSGWDDEPDDEADDETDGGPAGSSDPSLLGTGVRVRADVQHVRPTGRYADNGSQTYRVVAQWLDPDRHEVRVFASDAVPFDPTPYLEGRTVDVWIDPHDAGRHFVDVSFLPRAAG